ncbi:MAG: sterol desaturase/sphingolipid hydroxylase (fatty acid hydroxylase superfamily) [Arenicella sp.]|jgi:sterol desaturase/sphingolipid hydroxylase (fatty acid hydroxylase superfamily)
MINVLILRLAIPITLVISSKWATEHSFGLFNNIEITPWIAVVVCIVVLDFAIYWQHVATHRINILWKIHKIHHSDKDMDVSTSIRFHPFELILSLIYKALLVIALGTPVVAVILFELLLIVSSAFNHSNLKLPLWLDRKLRWIIATPDLHRIHHSVIVDEQNTNYGFFIIWWDKLFSTFTSQPTASHHRMSIGLKDDDNGFDRVDKMLLGPFR